LQHTKLALIVLGIILVAAYVFFEVHMVRVTKYTVYIENLPEKFDGFTLLQLSDFHSKQFGKEQQKLMDLINKQDYDLVVITGDLTNKHNPKTEPVAQLLKRLAGKPVYFVPGNHEWWNGFKTRKLLQESGVNIFINSAEKIQIADQHVWLVGVDDPYRGRDDLKTALAGTDDGAPKVLLAHAPNIFPEAISRKVDLLLVGHTHGGQVRLPFVGALVIPGQGFLPKWDYGMFETGKTTMIVNSGLGESDLSIRINNRAEIVLVTLNAARK